LDRSKANLALLAELYWLADHPSNHDDRRDRAEGRTGY